LVIAILGRDLLLSIVVLFQRLRGRSYLEVTFLGKAATFNLLYAFPLLLLSQVSMIGHAAFVIGWAFAIWGVTLYFYTGFQYLFSALRTSR